MGYTGRGRVVTFLDDGLEFDHPDLQENYVCLFKDFIFKNNFFFLSRIDRTKTLVQISMGMIMIQHLVMSQPMKISKILIY
jgi:hypothetical protein